MEDKQKRKFKMPKLPGLSTIKTWIIVGLVLVICVLGLNTPPKQEDAPKSTKLTMENIGELSTQVAYVTTVDVFQASRTLFDTLKIPFTTSKCIYSYDSIVKAGIDFEKVVCEIDLENKSIVVTYPEIKVFSHEIEEESLRVYHEEESIFLNITLEMLGESRSKLKETALNDAIGNGLLDNAEVNAKTIITNFLAQHYNLDEFTIEYIKE